MSQKQTGTWESVSPRTGINVFGAVRDDVMTLLLKGL